MNTFSNILNKTIVIIFLLCLIAPNIVSVLNLEKHIVDNENVEFKTFPNLTIKDPKKSIKNIKSFYKGNFGLKKTLMNNYISFKRDYLNEDAVPNSVVTGKDGWYFLGDQYNKVVTNTFNNVNDTTQLNFIVNNLKQINNYLKSKNIQFYITVPPNKHSIYSEFLPYKLKKKTTFYDLFKDRIKNTNLNLIDLHAKLLNEKNNKQVYVKTDSHWNKLGAFIAYQDVINSISKDIEIKPVNYNNYNVFEEEKSLNDLTKMINLVKTTSVVIFEKRTKTQIDTISSKHNNLHFKNANKSLKLLMSRDSFSDAWVSFYNETFGETRFIKTYNLNKDVIETYKPDIVIFEVAERNLINLSTVKSIE